MNHYQGISSPFDGQVSWGDRQDAAGHGYAPPWSAGAGPLGQNQPSASYAAPSPQLQSLQLQPSWGQGPEPMQVQVRRESSVNAFGAAAAPYAAAPYAPVTTTHAQYAQYAQQHQQQQQHQQPAASGNPQQPRYLPPAGQLAAPGPSTAPFSSHGKFNGHGHGHHGHGHGHGHGNGHGQGQPYAHPRTASAAPGQYASGPAAPAGSYPQHQHQQQYQQQYQQPQQHQQQYQQPQQHQQHQPHQQHQAHQQQLNYNAHARQPSADTFGAPGAAALGYGYAACGPPHPSLQLAAPSPSQSPSLSAFSSTSGSGIAALAAAVLAPGAHSHYAAGKRRSSSLRELPPLRPESEFDWELEMRAASLLGLDEDDEDEAGAGGAAGGGAAGGGAGAAGGGGGGGLLGVVDMVKFEQRMAKMSSAAWTFTRCSSFAATEAVAPPPFAHTTGGGGAAGAAVGDPCSGPSVGSRAQQSFGRESISAGPFSGPFSGPGSGPHTANTYNSSGGTGSGYAGPQHPMQQHTQMQTHTQTQMQGPAGRPSLSGMAGGAPPSIGWAAPRVSGTGNGMGTNGGSSILNTVSQLASGQQQQPQLQHAPLSLLPPPAPQQAGGLGSGGSSLPASPCNAAGGAASPMQTATSCSVPLPPAAAGGAAAAPWVPAPGAAFDAALPDPAAAAKRPRVNGPSNAPPAPALSLAARPKASGDLDRMLPRPDAAAAPAAAAAAAGGGGGAAEDAATLAIRRSILQREALLQSMEAQIL
ncbi:hypothetical protein HXX76_001873 [Chlamydomonas incerta]|uniref:Uncharacterized protein n=1 Tax=Chlamydomonas incerta TaxID=51695 RepID=A0A835TG64_CHLIN|nr:hypothetical protein HXX76_001873 [Chlamydomonas incerta]|eukprot:KAG2443521.1 hypothetical protein HXX76_001873 [Chlamydomonas incerta]